jgi:phosphate uptake regulator
MIDKKAGISSFQVLIDALEHIEVNELHSDIPANVRAELMRMKNNLSAILSFLGNCSIPDPTIEPRLSEAISTVRQECMSLHLTISKILLLQFFRLNLVMDLQTYALAAVQYERIGQAVCEICQMFAPQFAEQLSNAL